MSDWVKRFWCFLDWTFFVYRHQHWSLTCRGEGDCDPRAHLNVFDAWRISGVLR